MRGLSSALTCASPETLPSGSSPCTAFSVRGTDRQKRVRFWPEGGAQGSLGTAGVAVVGDSSQLAWGGAGMHQKRAEPKYTYRGRGDLD